MPIQETTFEAKTYLLWKKEIEIKNIMEPSLWQNAWTKVHEYAGANNLQITGPGVATYFSWDETSGKGEIGIGNPVSGNGGVDDPDLTLFPVESSKALILSVTGSYDQLRAAHGEIGQAAAEKNLQETLRIEEYLVTGMDNPDPSEWKTNIYLLYK